MTRYTVCFFILLACGVFLSCEQAAGTYKTGENETGLDSWLETETDPPDPADYHIDLKGINKSEVLFSTAADQYQDNPFLNGQWEFASGSGYVYLYKTDGTVSSTHHCGLVFPNQFSYVLYKNWLVLFGSEMDEDRLEVLSIHMPEGSDDALVFITRDPATGESTGWDIFVRTAEDPSPGDFAPPPYTPFLGTWTGSDGAEYEFRNNGTYTVTAGGSSTEYSYLVRGGKFVTLTHGEFETVNGAVQWKTFPAVSERTWSGGGGMITLSGGLILHKQPG